MSRKKSDNEKRLQGRTTGKNGREGMTAPENLPAVPEAPERMTDAAKAAWSKLGPELHRRGMLTELDLIPLEVLCTSVGHYLSIQKAIEDAPDLIVKGSTGQPMVNPLHKELVRYSEVIRKWAAELGLTPTARDKMGVPLDRLAPQSDSLEALLTHNQFRVRPEN